VLTLATAVWLAALSPWPQAVDLRFGDRCVTVSVDGGSVRALLSEWARLGRVKITGIEQVPDRPVSLHAECADERTILAKLIDPADGLMVPREADAKGASVFVAVAILSRPPSLPRQAKVANVIPEIAYSDPAPGRDWSAVPPDPEGPPAIVIQPVPVDHHIQQPGVVQEASVEYVRPATSGLSEVLLPRDSDRDEQQLRKLIELIQSGAVPESLFDYAVPVRTSDGHGKKPQP
jgi:hypothetical protein